MPRVEMLAASGFPAPQADALGHTIAFDLTATGTTQNDAYPLAHTVNVFNTVAAGTGARLPAVDTWKAGWIAISNVGANELQLYPAVGEYIYPNAVNVAEEVPDPDVYTIPILQNGAILYCAVRANGNRTWAMVSAI